MTEDIQAHKVIVLGDAGVGKTSIISNYIYKFLWKKIYINIIFISRKLKLLIYN